MSKLVSNETCPQCRATGKDTDGNNLWTYKDGGKYCHSCGYIDNSERDSKLVEQSKYIGKVLQGGHFEALVDRKIPQKVCEFYDYQVAKFTGTFHTGKVLKDEQV